MVDNKYTQSAATRSRLASSRRTRSEQARLTKQTWTFVGASIVVIVIFVAVVIPGIIRILGLINRNSPGPVIQEDVIIQAPVLSAPVDATFSAELTLSGVSQQGLQIIVVNNGQQVADTATKDDGSFQVDLTLQEGENILAAYAVNFNQQESKLSQEYKVIYDQTPPALKITEPVDNQSIQGKKNQTLTIKGTTEEKARVYVNDRLGFAKDDGSFSATFHLAIGSNTITIRAVDEAGNSTEEKLTVTFAE